MEEELDFRNLVKRVGGTGEFIRHRKNVCTGCGKCASVCPMQLWELRKGKASLREDYAEKCLECGTCWLVCDSNAIDFTYPKGGTGVVWEYG
ncbi:MAG: 4Fe-4S dicluster domain-containing protein [Candidatus Freyarchaeota archaeon]